MTEKSSGNSGREDEKPSSAEHLPAVQVEHADVPGEPFPAIQHDPITRDTVDTLDSDQPPAYGEIFGHVEDEQEDLGTHADVADDGRVNIHINQKGNRLASLFHSALQRQTDRPPLAEPYVPPTLGRRQDLTKPPKLNVVIHVVGSRGDVQPFVALGKVLKEEYGHRVRLATHPVFRDFVKDNGLEFFNIGGDPSELMAFMVKNPGLMPGFDTLRSGDVGHRRKEIGKMVKGCWRSCIESGDGSGPEANDNTVDDWTSADNGLAPDADSKPFVADAIIANPPSFAHIHCAEKLGIPLHMMFTMPWSPTQAFPHPLANIQSTNADISMTNFMTYALVDMMTWQGLGDVINRFRRKTLGLDEISLTWAPGMLARIKVPFTYCWSPALIPKPRDWQSYISISGFFFLNLASNYTPEPDLKAFLDAGPPPVYIGFGSIVLDDPDGMTRLIFEAIKQTGHRALVSKGWGGFGAEDIGIPDGVFMLGNVPHDWLFKHVSAVVHHGGAGTTAAGIAAGKPTVIVPFFGDQPFWGAMVHKAGAGPAPIASKKLTADTLASGIKKALSPNCVEKAKDLSHRISKERGSEVGAEKFHQELNADQLRCQLSPKRAAIWRIRRTDFRLSAFAATVLAQERLLDFKDLKLYRSRELDVDEGPWDPITGGAGSVVGTMGSMAMGIADMPVATLKALKIHPEHRRAGSQSPAAHGSQSGHNSSNSSSTSHSRNRSESLAITSNELKSSRLDALSSIGRRHRRSSSASSASSMASAREAAAAHDVGDAFMDMAKGQKSNGAAEKQKPFKFNADDLDTLLSTGKGAWKFTEAGIKSPLDFTLALAKGFHNAPKLYGDETVRKPEKITDFQSGIRAASKEFGYGLYDGITGLVTQPLRGAKKEGTAGFVKGFGKGIGGIALKPGAAIWALPGFTAQGMYREIRNRFGPSVEGYIIAARTAQGYEEMQQASSEEYTQLIKDWDDVRGDIKKKKNIGEEKMEEIKGRYRDVGSRSRSLSMSSKDRSPERHPTDVRHPASAGHPPSTGHPLRHVFKMEDHDPHGEGPSDKTAAIHDIITKHELAKKERGTSGSSDFHDAEYEAAIKESIKETSRGNSEEDEAIERAIRASMAEISEAQQRGANPKELEKSIQESLADARQGNLSRGNSYAVGRQSSHGGDHHSESAQAASNGQHDGELERAITESKSITSQHDEDLKRAITESEAHAASASGGAPEDDTELKRAVTASLQHHENEAAARQKAKDEEEIVMKYVMRQSEAEENLRKQKSGESSGAGAAAPDVGKEEKGEKDAA